MALCRITGIGRRPLKNILFFLSGLALGSMLLNFNLIETQDNKSSKMAAKYKFTEMLHQAYHNSIPRQSLEDKTKINQMPQQSFSAVYLPRIHSRTYMNPIRAIFNQNFNGTSFGRTLENILKDKKVARDVVFSFSQEQNRISTVPWLPSLSITPGINCVKLFKSDLDETMAAEQILAKNKQRYFSDYDLYKWTANCTSLKRNRGYVTHGISKEEKEFPIAYSIVMYKDPSQTERLLRAIYRPHNTYCIHLDTKISETVNHTMRALANCFENVFIASKLVNITWGGMSVLQADLNCMRDLWKRSLQSVKKWKYFINLTGQEFPLKTNLEIVQILKSYDGSNDIGFTVNRAWHSRWNCIRRDISLRCIAPKPKPPGNLTMGKGPLHVTLSRKFVDFVLHDRTAQKFLVWLNDTSIPDETFFQTLILSKHLGVPGAYTGPPITTLRPPQGPVRFKKWRNARVCKGRSQREICLLSLWDLPELAFRPELFVNKFEAFYHDIAYSCLEELHINKTREDLLLAAAAEGKSWSILDKNRSHLPYYEVPWIKYSKS